MPALSLTVFDINVADKGGSWNACKRDPGAHVQGSLGVHCKRFRSKKSEFAPHADT